VQINAGTLIYIALDDFVPPKWMNWAFCLTLLIAFVLLLFVKEQYKLTTIDQKSTVQDLRANSEKDKEKPLNTA
jgi:protein-S-isoprenylcysteine O-methyltransferase Ste14